MPTKYILGSGGSKNKPELRRKLFTEIVKGSGNNPRILMCYFAMPRTRRESRFEEDQEGSSTYFPPNVYPKFSLAFPDTFVQQIKDNDIVYLSGGDDYLIQYRLNQFQIPQIWEGKVVATSSASSDALVKYFRTCDWRQNKDGLGILPIKFIPHYQSSYGVDDPRGPINRQQAYEELKNYGDPTLPIYALPEGEFIVIEK